MSFKPENLTSLLQHDVFTLWHYQSGDKFHEMMTTTNYFGEACERLRPGDRIIVESRDRASADLAVTVTAGSSENNDGYVEVQFVAGTPFRRG